MQTIKNIISKVTLQDVAIIGFAGIIIYTAINAIMITAGGPEIMNGSF